MNKRVLLVVILMAMLLALTSCTEADRASQNTSKAADNFEVTRRIVFYNGITGDYVLVIEGLCSLGNYDDPGELSVTCKISDTEYKKHFLGLSDNVTYFSEQVGGYEADPFHYRVIFRPETIIPDIEIDTTIGN